MRVLVTGANGFLGRQILAELKSQGYTPLAFVRGAQSAKQLQDNGFECVVGTLDSPSDLYNALENVPAIIHAAGDLEEEGAAQQHQSPELEGSPAPVGKRTGLRLANLTF